MAPWTLLVQTPRFYQAPLVTSFWSLKFLILNVPRWVFRTRTMRDILRGSSYVPIWRDNCGWELIVAASQVEGLKNSMIAARICIIKRRIICSLTDTLHTWYELSSWVGYRLHYRSIHKLRMNNWQRPLITDCAAELCISKKPQKSISTSRTHSPVLSCRISRLTGSLNS